MKRHGKLVFMDPMMIRALNQRQNQSPQRFFEAGTHGQPWSSPRWPDPSGPINNPNIPHKERPEDVEVKETSVGRVHPTQQRVDELEYTETVQGPRRADMQATNMGRGGRRRGEHNRGNPRDDMWWRLHEGIGEGALFDEDPEDTESTSVARRANRDPLWAAVSARSGRGGPELTPEQRDKNEELRQEAGRAQLEDQMRNADPVGGQRRIREQIDAAIRGLNPEVFKEDDRKVFGGAHGESPEWGPLVRSAPQPEAEVEPFRHPGGPYFDQGTKGMWSDAASMLLSYDLPLPAWVSGVAVGVGGTGLWNDRRVSQG